MNYDLDILDGFALPSGFPGVFLSCFNEQNPLSGFGTEDTVQLQVPEERDEEQEGQQTLPYYRYKLVVVDRIWSIWCVFMSHHNFVLIVWSLQGSSGRCIAGISWKFKVYLYPLGNLHKEEDTSWIRVST